MGLLRLLFAESVLITHSGPIFGYYLINKQIAVQSFFIISGFYMSLILHEKYIGKNGGYKLFLTNRFLRIYPLYWCILLATFSFVLAKFFLHIGSDNAITHFLTFYSHTSFPVVFFAAVEYFLRNITLIVTTDYFLVNPREPGHLLVLQAWTLQVEFLFYLVAPFLVKRSARLLLFFIVGFILLNIAILMPQKFISNLTLTYVVLDKFVFFLLGIASYRLYKIIEKRKLSPRIPLFVFFGFVFFIFFYSVLPVSIPNFLYYLLFPIILPFIFIQTNKIVIDRFIGELSYPVYLSHLLIIKAFENLHVKMSGGYYTISVSAAAIIISLFLVRFIEIPIDRIRQSRFLQQNTKKR